MSKLEKEKLKQTNTLMLVSVPLATMGLFFISLGAFSSTSRRKILKRDGYKSVLSGETDNLEASHLDHSRDNPNYDHPSNGRTLTTKEHYLDHYNRHGRNGLTKKQNIWALNKIWSRLTEEEKIGLPDPRLK